MEKLFGLVGLFVMIGICYALSTNRKKIEWRTVINGTFLQLFFALLVLKTHWGQYVFYKLDGLVNGILGQSKSGIVFLFGKVLGDSETASKLFGPENGFFFAFQALPIIIFMSMLTALLYHLGILHYVVAFMARIMRSVMRLSGAEACSTAANVFLGHTESPLVVRPYLEKMTRSELHCIMAGGLATIAGSTLGGYVAMLSGKIDNIAAHFIAASIMSAPAAVVFAKLLVPEDEIPETLGKYQIPKDKIDTDLFSACSRGCSEGLQMALNVAAMLMGFLATTALLEWLWNSIMSACGLGESFSLMNLVGYFFSPFACLLGIPFGEAVKSGFILGEKTLLNEFVAYSHFAQLLNGEWACSERTRIILSYALCGFANISSLGMLLGGLGSLIPSRKNVLAKLLLRSLLAGTFASFSTAIIVGVLL